MTFRDLLESKIKYVKGKSYMSGDNWVVYANKDRSNVSIKVDRSSGWGIDPHDEREETWRLMSNGRTLATYSFKDGNLKKFAQDLYDIAQDKVGSNQLTSEQYYQIIVLWIDMKKARDLTEAPSDEKRIKSALSKFNVISIPAIGRYGKEFLFTVVFGTKNLKEAENFDIKGAVKALKREFPGVVFDKDIKDDTTPGGIWIQGADWRKDGPNDPHEIYVAFKEVTK